MLDSGKLIGFLVTTDYDKAREFYEKRLGFEFISLDQFALVVRVGGHHIRITKASRFTALQSTVLGWEVDDVVATVKWLAARGVHTEKYPFVPDKQLGIWEAPGGAKIAWFKDPDGNVLSVGQSA
jgi:catechol 2,3-dioxygenase-like lactoylglutathione lyase family enzyme